MVYTHIDTNTFESIGYNNKTCIYNTIVNIPPWIQNHINQIVNFITTQTGNC